MGHHSETAPEWPCWLVRQKLPARVVAHSLFKCRRVPPWRRAAHPSYSPVTAAESAHTSVQGQCRAVTLPPPSEDPCLVVADRLRDYPSPGPAFKDKCEKIAAHKGIRRAGTSHEFRFCREKAMKPIDSAGSNDIVNCLRLTARRCAVYCTGWVFLVGGGQIVYRFGHGFAGERGPLRTSRQPVESENGAFCLRQT